MNPAPLCKHLRTKSMYIPALAEAKPAEPEDDFGHPRHYWCNCTMTETGPDDKHVGPGACTAQRRCFEE